MKNEKIKNYIIICLSVLLIISSIGFFRSCNDRSGSGGAAEITRGLSFLVDTVQDSLGVLSSIKGCIGELYRERDHYRGLAEQFREANTEYESIFNELQNIYSGFGDYKRQVFETNRNLRESCKRLGIEIENGLGDLERLGNTISELCKGTEAETD